MDTLESLTIPVPPILEEALGYWGQARWVAFYWTPAGDELAWDDDLIRGVSTIFDKSYAKGSGPQAAPSKFNNLRESHRE